MIRIFKWIPLIVAVIVAAVIVATALAPRNAAFYITGVTEVLSGDVRPVVGAPLSAERIIIPDGVRVCHTLQLSPRAQEAEGCPGMTQGLVAVGESALRLDRPATIRVERAHASELVLYLDPPVTRAGDDPARGAGAGASGCRTAHVGTFLNGGEDASAPLCDATRIAFTGVDPHTLWISFSGENVRIGELIGPGAAPATPTLLAADIQSRGRSIIGYWAFILGDRSKTWRVALGDTSADLGEVVYVCSDANPCLSGLGGAPSDFFTTLRAAPDGGLTFSAQAIGRAMQIDGFGDGGRMILTPWYQRVLNDPYVYGLLSIMIGSLAVAARKVLSHAIGGLLG